MGTYNLEIPSHLEPSFRRIGEKARFETTWYSEEISEIWALHLHLTGQHAGDASCHGCKVNALGKVREAYLQWIPNNPLNGEEGKG